VGEPDPSDSPPPRATEDFADLKAPARLGDDRTSTTPSSTQVATKKTTKTGPASDPEAATSGATGVVSTPERPDNSLSASREQIASRSRRSELLRDVMTQLARAKPSSDDLRGKSKPFANLPPEASSPESVSPRVELFPAMSVADGHSAFLLREVEGRSFEDVCDALRRGQLPPAELVWPEEFVNRFRYSDPPTQRGALGVAMEAAKCPWNKESVLLRVTLRSAGAAGGVPDLPADPLRNVSVELRFATGVVRSYQLIACGQVDAKAAPTPSGSAAPGGSKPALDHGDWPAGRTATSLYLLAVDMPTSLAQMDNAKQRPGKEKTQPAPVPQRIASLTWRCDGPQGTHNGGNRALDYSAKQMAEASSDLRFAASAAVFALALRDFSPARSIKLAAAEDLARSVPNVAPAKQKDDLLSAIEAARKVGRP